MELLKEEIDLQQSFRLLLNLQEAWDYKVAPQKNNRSWIKPIDDDEEDQTDWNVKTK